MGALPGGLPVLSLKAMKRFTGNPLRNPACRRFAAGMVALALLVLALIPAGFMPSFGADGKIAIVICSGMGEKTIMVDADDAPASDQGTDACPYFLAQSPVSVDVAVPVLLPPSYDVMAFIPPAVEQPEEILILTPPARGPPSVTSA